MIAVGAIWLYIKKRSSDSSIKSSKLDSLNSLKNNIHTTNTEKTNKSSVRNFCTKCGAKVGPDDVFCRSCGNKLT